MNTMSFPRALLGVILTASLPFSACAANEATIVAESIKALSSSVLDKEITAVTSTTLHETVEPHLEDMPNRHEIVAVPVKNTLTTSTEYRTSNRTEMKVQMVANVRPDGTGDTLGEQEIIADNSNGVIINNSDGQLNGRVGPASALKNHLLYRQSPGMVLLDLWDGKKNYSRGLELAQNEEWQVEDTPAGKAYVLMMPCPDCENEKQPRARFVLDAKNRVVELYQFGRDGKTPFYSLEVDYNDQGQLISLYQKKYKFENETPVLTDEWQSRILSMRSRSTGAGGVDALQILRDRGISTYSHAVTNEVASVD